jgi:CRISPR system Cascade subunit CasB
MTDTTEVKTRPEERLINWLIVRASQVNDLPEARAAMAELRHGLEDPLRIARHVAPYLEGVPEKNAPWLYTLASLFAWHRRHEKGLSLGKAFRALRDDSGGAERRFLALIAARPDQLEDHLRYAIRLLASKGIALDWHELTKDVLNWDRPDKGRQHRLARDFYGTTRGAEDDSSALSPETLSDEESEGGSEE